MSNRRRREDEDWTTYHLPDGKMKVIRIVDCLPKDKCRNHNVTSAGHFKNYEVVVIEYPDCIIETWYVNISSEARDITGGRWGRPDSSGKSRRGGAFNQLTSWDQKSNRYIQWANDFPEQYRERADWDGIPIEEPDVAAGGHPARDGVDEAAAGAAAAAGDIDGDNDASGVASEEEESEVVRLRRELEAVQSQMQVQQTIIEENGLGGVLHDRLEDQERQEQQGHARDDDGDGDEEEEEEAPHIHFDDEADDEANGHADNGGAGGSKTGLAADSEEEPEDRSAEAELLRAKDEQVRALQLELAKKDAILAQHGLSEEMNEDDAGANANGGHTVVGGARGGGGAKAKAGKQQQQQKTKQQPKKPTRKQPPRSAARTSAAPKQQEKGIEEEEVVEEEETDDQSAEVARLKVARLKKQLQEVTAQLKKREEELKEKDDTIAQYRRDEDDDDGVGGGGWRTAYCGKEVSVQAGDGNTGGTVSGGVGGVGGEYATPAEVEIAVECMRRELEQKLGNFTQQFEGLCDEVKNKADEDDVERVMESLYNFVQKFDKKQSKTLCLQGLKDGKGAVEREFSEKKKELSKETEEMVEMMGKMQTLNGPGVNDEHGSDE